MPKAEICKMKKTIALALSLCTLASTLMSCSSSDAGKYSPEITVSSSNAEDYAVWLTNRLGDKLTDSVYLALGSDASRGIDMTDFENDGYILRTEGGSVTVAGKTETGLDLAVRRYANAVEAGTASELDASYHEGYRIEKLMLAGHDISEYAIEYPAEHNENMLYAVSEMQRLIKKACGAELDAAQGISVRECAIEFRHSRDDSLRYDGYRYFFEGSRLVIEGAVERGCMWGVWFFLENELGWECINYGNSLLREADLIEVSADCEKTAVPSFDYFDPHVTYGMKTDTERYNPRKSIDSKYSYGAISYACHGTQMKKWGGYNTVDYQLCYTDEGVFYNVKDDIIERTENALAAGSVIGKDLKSVDVSQGDNGDYCHCTECMKVFKEEGGAMSGCVVRWANRLEEEISAEEGGKYDGLVYLIFAYMGTQPHCRTAPNENVYLTFAMNGTCSAHGINSRKCTSRGPLGPVTEQPIINNDNFAEWTKGWCDLSDNIYIWYYGLDTSVQQYTIIDAFFDDMKFFAECGAAGVFLQFEKNGLGMQPVWGQLAYMMNWNPDMTREEYDLALEHLLQKDYGDGYGYILEYLDIWQESQDKNNCWDCWEYASILSDTYDTEYYAENFDRSVYLLERAAELASSKAQQTRCELLTAHIYYEGCYSSYFRAYDNGDTERIAVLSERYDRIMKILAENRINYKWMNGGAAAIQTNLEDSAWLDWIKVRDELPCGDVRRPMPDKYSG